MYTQNDRSPYKFYDGEHARSKDPSKTAKNANLQEIFLNNCRRNEDMVTIDLLSGTKKEGKIAGFDAQSIILLTNDRQLLIYKSAVLCMTPHEPIRYIFNEHNKKDYLARRMQTTSVIGTNR